VGVEKLRPAGTCGADMSDFDTQTMQTPTLVICLAQWYQNSAGGQIKVDKSEGDKEQIWQACA
jgi:hypothetical protein